MMRGLLPDAVRHRRRWKWERGTSVGWQASAGNH
jgi:hypothetical protein